MPSLPYVVALVCAFGIAQCPCCCGALSPQLSPLLSLSFAFPVLPPVGFVACNLPFRLIVSSFWFNHCIFLAKHLCKSHKNIIFVTHLIMYLF